MARSCFLLYSLSRRRVSDTLRSLFFIPTALALTTSLLIIFYISSTSNLFNANRHVQSIHHILQNPKGVSPRMHNLRTPIGSQPQSGVDFDSRRTNSGVAEDHGGNLRSSNGKIAGNGTIFHDQDIFMEDYIKMNTSFKIYMYPHNKNDPFANILLPVPFEPEGNYASESFFKKSLNNSHFLTKDPSKADLFFLPFSIARLRHDPRVGIEGIQDFIKDYIFNVSQNYPFWNRTGGADHFYVSCHSIGRVAINKAEEIKLNAIQVVCSSSYFVHAYVPHKDASLPQIWPREQDPVNMTSSKRKKLAFFAGSINSPVRQKLVETWQNNTKLSIHSGHINTSYEQSLQDSKFCLHVKGFEVNTARIGDALYHGCVPVIIANYYDLPFADILNWKSFSIIVATLDIPLLQRILDGISHDEYANLQHNVFEVRKHFRWHVVPVDYDAFYMVMYELWLRRSSIRVPLS